MINPIPNGIKNLWNKWNIRGAVLFSLLLQITLILIAPLRKRTAKKIIILLVWSCYLLADATAVFAVGLISRAQENTPAGQAPPDNPHLLAFWAPFLLLHLGGPDTITAFALEDNQLWLRHLLTLFIQVIGTSYVFLQTLPKNEVWIPTLLLFLSGIIKYLERTRSLSLASMDRFRDSMLRENPDYAKLMIEYDKKDVQPPKTNDLVEQHAKLPTTIKLEKCTYKKDAQGKTSLTRLEIVQVAYGFFQTFKGIVVDLVFSIHQRDTSRFFFDTLKTEDALTLIEVELNFIYENLFTKAIVLRSFVGKMFRFLSSASIVTALVLFHYHVNDKHATYNSFDIGVTYALLWGAIGLDFLSLLMAVFSDWTVAALKKDRTAHEVLLGKTKAKIAEWVTPIFNWFLQLSKEPLWVDCKTNEKPVVTHTVMASPILRRRWAGYVFGHSLVRYCLRGSPKQIYNLRVQGYLDLIASSIEKVVVWILWLIKEAVVHAIGAVIGLPYSKVFGLAESHGCRSIMRHHDKITWENFIDWVGVKDFLDGILYTSKEPLPKGLWEFIFDEVKKKSLCIENDLEAAKRIYSATGDWVLQHYYNFSPQNALMGYILERPYGESLVIWHIATDLLYHTEAWKTDDHAEEQSDSDVESVTIMPDASVPIVIEEIYSARIFSKILSDYMCYLLFMQPNLTQAVAGIGRVRFQDTCAEAERFFKERGFKEGDDAKASEVILGDGPPVLQGDAMFFDAITLARELQKWKEEKWKLISRVWVEKMSYAATHCRPNAHAQQLSKGGELLSIVWLLMTHFGLVDKFQNIRSPPEGFAYPWLAPVPAHRIGRDG